MAQFVILRPGEIDEANVTTWVNIDGYLSLAQQEVRR